MFKSRGWQKRSKPIPTSPICRQRISSPIYQSPKSVVNIDLAEKHLILKVLAGGNFDFLLADLFLAWRMLKWEVIFNERENYCSLSLRSYLFISWSVISHDDINFILFLLLYFQAINLERKLLRTGVYGCLDGRDRLSGRSVHRALF